MRRFISDEFENSVYDLIFKSRGRLELRIAQLLGHANSTQILPTYVKPLDENTRAVINELDAARTSQAGRPSSIH